MKTDYANESELQNSKKQLSKMYHECKIVSIIDNIKSFYDFNKENISLDYKFVVKPLTRVFYDTDTEDKKNYIIASPIYVSLR